MIETREQVYQAIEQMGRMQRIRESYRNEILGKSPSELTQFQRSAFAEGGFSKGLQPMPHRVGQGKMKAIVRDFLHFE